MKNFLRIIRRSGKGPIFLYLALLACFFLLIVNSLTPVTSNETLAKFAAALALGFLAELLWYELERKDQNKEGEASNSGITSFYPRLNGRRFEELMSSPGHKIILNTWIFNNSSITIQLEEALKYDKTRIDIVILSPKSKHVETRNEEIPDINVLARIKTCRDDIAFFVKNLSPEKQVRVKIFEFDSLPRITLYSNDDEAFVGFYWPNSMAVHTPQFLIKGRHGKLAEMAWDYYDQLKKTEITAELIQLAASDESKSG